MKRLNCVFKVKVQNFIDEQNWIVVFFRVQNISLFFCFCFFLSLSIFLQLNLSVWCTVNNCSQSGHMPTYIIMRHIVGGILPQGSKACLVLLFLVLFYFFLVCARERDTEPFLSCWKNHVSVVKSLSSWPWQNFNAAFFFLFSKTMQDANLCHAWLDPEPCLRFLSNQAQLYLFLFCFVCLFLWTWSCTINENYFNNFGI